MLQDFSKVLREGVQKLKINSKQPHILFVPKILRILFFSVRVSSIAHIAPRFNSKYISIFCQKSIENQLSPKYWLGTYLCGTNKHNIGHKLRIACRFFLLTLIGLPFFDHVVTTFVTQTICKF